MNFRNLFLVVAGLKAASSFGQTSGQNFTTSPYSNFGLGEILNQNLVQAGSQSQTWSGAYSYSLLNPATLSNLKYTSFDFGFSQRTGAVESGTQKQTFNGGSLNYISLGFQLWHKDVKRRDTIQGIPKVKVSPFVWNAAINLYPSTSIGYNYTFESLLPYKTSTAHSGKGGINAFEWSNGFRLGKHISLGYAIGNLFGQMSDKSLFSAPDSTQFNIVEDEKKVNLRGWQQTAGAMFNFSFDSTYHRFGASFRWHSGMRAQTERLTRTLEISNFSVSIVDTILNLSSAYKKFTMPTSFGVGYYFQYRRSFGIGIDYRKQLWGNYSAYFEPNTKLTNRNDYGFAFTLFPEDEKNPTKKRMSAPIRLGGRYSVTQNALTSAGNTIQIEEQSAYIGFGIPFTRRYFDNRVLRSMIHVQVDYLQRGKNLVGLAREQYLIFTVGLNLGDIWFQRRKFD